MAGPIILNRAPAELLARAAEIKGQGIASAAGNIEQSMFAYLQQRAEDERRKDAVKLSALGTLIGKFGNDIGPGALGEYEKLTGVTLPKDAAGQPQLPVDAISKLRKELLPQVAEKIRTDPATRDVFMGLAKPPTQMSADEKQFKTEEMDLKRQQMDVDTKIAQIRANAAMVKSGNGKEPSGYVNDPQATGGIRWVGFDSNVPQLTRDQVASYEKGSRGTTRALRGEKAKIDVQLGLKKLAAAPDDPLMKMATSSILHFDSIERSGNPQAKAIRDQSLALFAKTTGIEIPAEDKRGWIKRMVDGLKGGAGVTTPIPVAAKTGRIAIPSADNTIRSKMATMSDDDLAKEFSNALGQGATPDQLLEQTGHDPRAFNILRKLVPTDPGADQLVPP